MSRISNESTYTKNLKIPFGKPLIELLMAVEQSWHNEMKKSPQLSHVILYGCTGKKQAISTAKAEQCFPPYTVKQ